MTWCYNTVQITCQLWCCIWQRQMSQITVYNQLSLPFDSSTNLPKTLKPYLNLCGTIYVFWQWFFIGFPCNCSYICLFCKIFVLNLKNLLGMNICQKYLTNILQILWMFGQIKKKKTWYDFDTSPYVRANSVKLSQNTEAFIRTITVNLWKENCSTFRI